jgi:hypothetical protein
MKFKILREIWRERRATRKDLEHYAQVNPRGQGDAPLFRKPNMKPKAKRKLPASIWQLALT